MFRYLLKGLTITFVVILAFIGISFGVGSLIYTNLTNSVDTAHERGYEEGTIEGYNAGLEEGTEAGYQEGSKVGFLEASRADAEEIKDEGYYFIYNPTYEEIMLALLSSEMNSAKEILDYAKANGIRAAYVRVPIAREAREGRVYLYQLVAFETVDKGFIIIEPRSHREVEVEVGRSYNELNDFPPSLYDDTITKVTVVW